MAPPEPQTQHSFPQLQSKTQSRSVILLDSIEKIIKPIAESPCDHKQVLKRLEDEINSLHKSVANLRKDIRPLIVKLLVDAEK